MVEAISPFDLIPMDVFDTSEPVKIDIVYADANHPENIFSAALYHEDARLSLHRDLARVVIAAARVLRDRHDMVLILKDGLRPVEAQAAMSQIQIVRDNPQWLEEPGRLISPPGAGAHPRGMAIDVSLQTSSGDMINMGTSFDEMTKESARTYEGFSENVHQNRKILESAFMIQAEKLGLPFLALPSEWWDFRFPRSYYERWVALQDIDLPTPLRLINPAHDDTGEWDARFDKAKKEVLNSL